MRDDERVGRYTMRLDFSVVKKSLFGNVEEKQAISTRTVENVKCFACFLRAFMYLVIPLSYLPPSAADDAYRAPDGTLVKRVFDPAKDMRAHSTIALCSDSLEYYLDNMRRFVDYVFSDRKYRIIDGARIASEFDADSVTFVYLGKQPTSLLSDPCLVKSPNLIRAIMKGFDRISKQKQYLPISLFKSKQEGFVPLTCGSYWGPREDGVQIGFAGLQWGGGEYKCAEEYYTLLFGLDNNFCQVNDCKFLHK